MSKKKVLADPVVVTFFECTFFGDEKKILSKKNYKYGIKAPIKSHTSIFFEMNIFSIPKKLQVHFKKIYNDWIRSGLKIQMLLSNYFELHCES